LNGRTVGPLYSCGCSEEENNPFTLPEIVLWIIHPAAQSLYKLLYPNSHMVQEAVPISLAGVAFIILVVASHCSLLSHKLETKMYTNILEQLTKECG